MALNIPDSQDRLLTTEEYKACQWSADWDSNLVKYKASKPDATDFATQETSFDGPGTFAMEGCREKRKPKSLVTSSGPESYICPETQFLNNWQSCYEITKELINSTMAAMSKTTSIEVESEVWKLHYQVEWSCASSFTKLHLYGNQL